MNETASNRNGETPMESWKEIGAYSQRDTTTARRREKEEGLPVHRHNHKSPSSDGTLYERSLALSPDGSRIAYNTARRVEELWTLDNVFSALK